MSDRNVREPANALAQRLNRLEEQVRAMKLKAWSGAIRTAQADVITPEEPAAWTTLLSLTATAGRWVVIARSHFLIPSVTTYFDARLFVQAFDPTSGDLLTGDDYDLRVCVDWMNPFTGVRSSPLLVTGHFVTNDVVTITMSGVNAAGDAYTAYSCGLVLIPV